MSNNSTPANSVKRAVKRTRHYIQIFKKVIILFVVFVIALIGWKLFPMFYMKHMAVHPPIMISAETAKSENWSEQIRVIGSLAAVRNVVLAPEIGGIVKKISVESGQFVHKDTPILQLNDDVEEAELQRYQAQLEYSEASLNRSEKLTKGNVETLATYEQKDAKKKEDTANVEQAKATITKKNITAPFEGFLGIWMVNLGQYLQPGTPIITLTDARELYVNFSVPERYLTCLKKGQKIKFSVDAFPDQDFEGTIRTIESQINEQTRTIDVQAIHENKDLKLSSGMFADIRVLEPEQKKVVTVSETAIEYGLYGSTVYVLEKEISKPDDQNPKDNEEQQEPVYLAKRVTVKTGDNQKGRIVVLSGLTAGQQIVSSGQIKIDSGARVAISEEPRPTIPNQISNE